MNPYKTSILGTKEEKIQSARDKFIYDDKRVFQFVSKRAARFFVPASDLEFWRLAFGILCSSAVSVLCAKAIGI
jgi:hypothetical protein